MNEKKNIDRLIDSILLLSFVAISISSLISSYFFIPFTSSLSFKVQDGWCEPESQGIGLHCFGDFYYGLDLMELGGFYENSQQPYPPGALLTYRMFHFINGFFGDGQLALLLFFVISIALFLKTLIKIDTKIRAAKLATVCIFSGPFLVAIDRGNLILLTILPLYLFVTGYLDGKRWSYLYLVIACLIKPQFLLFGLIYLRNRKFKDFFQLSLAYTVITFLSFSLLPGNLFANFYGWIKGLIFHQNYSIEASHYPVNLSLVNQLFLFVKIEASLKANEITDVFISNKSRSMVVLMLSILLVIILLLPKSFITDFEVLLLIGCFITLAIATSFHYNLIISVPFFLAYVLRIVKHSPATSSFSEYWTTNWNKKTYTLFLVTSWVPLTLPLSLFIDVRAIETGSEVSITWMIVGFVLAITYFGVSVAAIARYLSVLISRQSWLPKLLGNKEPN